MVHILPTLQMNSWNWRIRGPVWDQPVKMCYASSDVKAISEYSWLLTSLSRVGPHLTPFLPLLHVSICVYIVIVQVLFGQPHCYSILVSFSVTSGRLSLTTDFLFQCLLESFTPCLLMCRSYVVGVSIWAAHISYSLYSDQFLFSVKISICCRGKPLWCRVRATFNFVCKEKCRQRFLSHLVL